MSINLEAALNIDFAFGYDTKGLRDFADSDFRNPLLLANGLYVDDDPTPGDPSDGPDPPELTFDGGLWAAAELNLGIARGGVGGGIFIGVDFNLFDNDGDGKVRLDELATNFLNQLRADNELEKLLAPLAIFDVTGEVTAELFAFLKIDFGFFELDKKFNITPPVTLLDFNVDFFRPPVLASELDNGDLIINIGDFADQRKLGDLTDFGEHIIIEGAGPGKVKVCSDNIDEDAKQPQIYNVTGKIIISGGEGDDMIEFVNVDPAITFDIDGGVGDDTIKGGGGGGIIHGGLGDDTLTGSDGADLIFGDEGDDVIDGRKGDDIVLGDKGEVSDGFTLTNRQGFVRALVSPTDGADTIDGGDDDDVIAGSGGADTLNGGKNNDIVIGDGGLFTYNSPPVVTETDKGQGDRRHDRRRRGRRPALRRQGRRHHPRRQRGWNRHRQRHHLRRVRQRQAPRRRRQRHHLRRLRRVPPERQDRAGASGAGGRRRGRRQDLRRRRRRQAARRRRQRRHARRRQRRHHVGRHRHRLMHGDDGNDTIFGESDPDKLFGDAGNDYLEGGQATTWLRAATATTCWSPATAPTSSTASRRGHLSHHRARRARDRADHHVRQRPQRRRGSTDNLVLIGTSQADTVLLRAMADFYFPTLEKLMGGTVNGKTVDGLTDKIFASEEPDKLRAVLQALEDAYGPHAVVKNVVTVDGANATLAALQAKIVGAYTQAVRTGVLAVVDSETDRATRRDQTRA